MHDKRLLSIILFSAGGLMCMLLLPDKIWLAIIGMLLIVIAVIVSKMC